MRRILAKTRENEPQIKYKKIEEQKYNFSSSYSDYFKGVH